jgi:peroxiredoxin
MHHKYGKKGFVAISVSVDDPGDKETVDEVVKFLRAQKAVIPNFLLDEQPEVWQMKLKTEAVPCIFVFNREGKIEAKYLEAGKHDEMDQLVEKLLDQK